MGSSAQGYQREGKKWAVMRVSEMNLSKANMRLDGGATLKLFIVICIRNRKIEAKINIIQYEVSTGQKCGFWWRQKVMLNSQEWEGRRICGTSTQMRDARDTGALLEMPLTLEGWRGRLMRDAVSIVELWKNKTLWNS